MDVVRWVRLVFGGRMFERDLHLAVNTLSYSLFLAIEDSSKY